MLYGKRYKNHEIRSLLMKKACDDFIFARTQRYEMINEKVDEHTVLFVKGYGNDIEIMSCFRDLLFNSREQLDYLLYCISKKTEHLSVNIPRDFLKFSKRLMSGDFDVYGFELLSFLKINITYIFHIRKIRNEIKNNISNIDFRFVTDHFEAAFLVPIKPDEHELVQYLDIANQSDAFAKGQYHCILNLDIYFPEMIEFWDTALSLLDKLLLT